MSDLRKTRIVIASVLKPVDDTRMTEKIGKTLAAAQAEVHIAGFPGAGQPAGVFTHPLPQFERLSAKRLAIPWRILHLVIRLRPHILIITTHELLWAALAAKIITGCKVIYDVQENYYRNIRYTDAFPFLLRWPLAGYVRLKEIITAPMVSAFLLAERAYCQELAFAAKKSTIIENKVKRRPPSPVAHDPYHLIFTGTLAESTGVFSAVELARRLHAIEPRIRLTIAGRCAKPATLKKLELLVAEHGFISFTGGNRLVPHGHISALIAGAGAGIISYPPNPATSGATPTKFFEYIGYGLPVLLTNHYRWVAMAMRYDAAVVFEPGEPDAPAILNALLTQTFYQRPDGGVFWDEEEPRLLQAVARAAWK